MRSQAVIMQEPGSLAIESIELDAPADGDVVVEIAHSGISTGTEKLLWEGRMPHFPGMGYPLVPGYEAVGEVVESRSARFHVGDKVFVPRPIEGLCRENVRVGVLLEKRSFLALPPAVRCFEDLSYNSANGWCNWHLFYCDDELCNFY